MVKPLSNNGSCQSFPSDGVKALDDGSKMELEPFLCLQEKKITSSKKKMSYLMKGGGGNKRVKGVLKKESAFVKRMRLTKPFKMPLYKRLASMKPEMKFFQTIIKISPTDATQPWAMLDGSTTRTFDTLNSGGAVLMNNIRVGSAEGQRIGKNILIKNISYIWSLDPGANALTSKLQWGILIDNQPNGSHVTMADAFNEVTVNGMIKNDHTDKYKILDRYFSHTSSATLSDNEYNEGRQGTGFLDFRGRKEGGLPINYYANDNNDASSILRGAIYLYLICDTAATKHYFNFSFRIKFTDA